MDYKLKPEHYINRELSWLAFNGRVLEEAQDKGNPLFERLKFLAIFSSNLDEFFMVRVAGVMTMADVKGTSLAKDVSGLTPPQQLAKISASAQSLVASQYAAYKVIVKGLKEQGIEFVSMKNLAASELGKVERFFSNELFPILTPMAIDAGRPFPFLSNCTLNMIIELADENTGKIRNAVVQVPDVVPRVYELEDNLRYVLLEDIIKHFAHRLFTGNRVISAVCFRITRNSDLDIDEEDAPDLLNEIERSVKKRKRGEPVRFEIEKNAKDKQLGYLQKTFKLDDNDVYEIAGPLDLKFLMGFYFQYGSAWPALRNFAFQPFTKPVLAGWDAPEAVFGAIRQADIILHHPYESFDPVINFVKAAAADPNVLAIKQTLYRVSGKSPIVAALMQAAENGKQVTVLIELKARFDEENNIQWAKKLEMAGCHVVYGLVGYKTHSKMCLVVRKEDDEIRRYIHLGTGNYNDSTARIYTDLGYFTCRESFAGDVSSLFNVLTGYSGHNKYNKLITAPTFLRRQFIDMIEQEAKNAAAGLPSGIIAKMNSLVDPEIIAALYRASQAGVQVKLIVRGICCLRPGVIGISENIEVSSIVDRYLEHSRIYAFKNAGEDRIYVSSADWMQRNFDRRVEIAFPIEDDGLKGRIMNILNLSLADNVKRRVLQPDGTYVRAKKRGDEVWSQILFHEES
ncbi:MAG: RNA degradosome polyphosphate kinase [Defluviitaleaceae bacterium]|nr:RNA degradosome polyphosphate kinase [Defluviitaleaceae bacterium]